MYEIKELSDQLKKICEYEISRGNRVQRVDKPAGTNCPLAVIFHAPLDVSGFLKMYGLPNGVETWENRDRHYPLEKGYVCGDTRHVLAGPTR